MARRKVLYELEFPETKQGASGGSNAGKSRSEVAIVASSVDRFTKTAANCRPNDFNALPALKH